MCRFEVVPNRYPLTAASNAICIWRNAGLRHRNLKFSTVSFRLGFIWSGMGRRAAGCGVNKLEVRVGNASLQEHAPCDKLAVYNY